MATRCGSRRREGPRRQHRLQQPQAHPHRRRRDGDRGGGLGGFAKAEADELVNVLRFGSLPFPVEELASDTIDPTLGEEFLNRSLFAGAIAITLVILFMLLHYRLPGLVASFALLFYAVISLALFNLFYVLGLATDYCVKFTALDARTDGFATFLVEDGCRGVELKPGDSDHAGEDMRAAGVVVLDSGSIAS